MTITYLVVGKNDKRTAPRRLHDDGEELGVDGTECGVPTALGHADIVVTLLPLQCLSVNVTKFWASHNPKWHFNTGFVCVLYCDMMDYDDATLQKEICRVWLHRNAFNWNTREVQQPQRRVRNKNYQTIIDKTRAILSHQQVHRDTLFFPSFGLAIRSICVGKNQIEENEKKMLNSRSREIEKFPAEILLVLMWISIEIWITCDRCNIRRGLTLIKGTFVTRYHWKNLRNIRNDLLH